uniref:Uncharacterized protein n=1 Tax=Lates calcarifer TaxID=8187 RepID=A0A4W6G9K6_LATCA
MSGSMSRRGAALFRSPTSSSNSEANTEEGRLMECSSSSSSSSSLNSDGPDASFRCCR